MKTNKYMYVFIYKISSDDDFDAIFFLNVLKMCIFIMVH